MTKNTERVIKVYTDAGFNLEHHSFKSVGTNQVRATIRTYSRINKDSKYTIDLFCDPLIRAGFEIVRCTTKSDPIPSIIPIANLIDPVRDAEIQEQMINNSRSLKGTLSILIELPEESPMFEYENQLVLIRADRYDTTNPQFPQYYSGYDNTWKDHGAYTSYHKTLEDMINTITEIETQYGEDNVSVHYIEWRGVFRVLIAQ